MPVSVQANPAATATSLRPVIATTSPICAQPAAGEHKFGGGGPVGRPQRQRREDGPVRGSPLTSPDSGHTSYRYDLAGRLIAKQTPNLVTGNRVITFAYDLNRLKSMDLPSTAGVIEVDPIVRTRSGAV